MYEYFYFTDRALFLQQIHLFPRENLEDPDIEGIAKDIGEFEGTFKSQKRVKWTEMDLSLGEMLAYVKKYEGEFIEGPPEC